MCSASPRSDRRQLAGAVGLSLGLLAVGITVSFLIKPHRRIPVDEGASAA